MARFRTETQTHLVLMPTIAPLDLDGHCLVAAFLGEVPVFGLASGTVFRLDHGTHSHELHDGLIATAMSHDGQSLQTGGEDGKVMSLTGDGVVSEIRGPSRKWVNAIAAGPQGALAWAEGKTAILRTSDGKTKEMNEARTVEALTFAPKGMRVALARYNGVSLHWGAGSAAPSNLEWNGAHSSVTFSPDGRFLVTSMQENALHGWKLDSKPGQDMKHMRMTGYPAKIRSLSWSRRGHWLASSGAPSAIVWPFSAKDGPMGKAPMELGYRGDTMVTCVACHPAEEMVAIGYADGMVLAVRLADSKEALLRRPGSGPISSMGWNSNGRLLAFGSEAGDCGVIDIAG